MRKPLTQYFLVPNCIVTSEKFQSKEEMILFIVILRFCNWSRRAFLSIETLISLSKMSRKSVFKYLKSLEKKEVIKIQRRKNRCNLYEIIWDYEEKSPKICKGKIRHSAGVNKILAGVNEHPYKEISLKNSLKEMSTQLPLEEKKSQESSLEKKGIDDSNLDEKNSSLGNSWEGNSLEDNDFQVELLTPIDDEIFERALEYQENKMYTLNNKMEREEESDIEMEFEEIFSEKEGKFIKVPAEKPDEKEIHFVQKRKLYKEITLLIGNSTGMGEFHAQNAVRLSGLTVEQLERLSLAIRESNFLSGRLIGKKPKLSHFSSFNQIFRILGGSYKNFEKSSYSYHQEYIPHDLKDAEPDFDD